MEEILRKLQELSLPYEPIHHDIVMTVEEQERALKGVSGAVAKNLFLKDKKGRLYIVTALNSTRVNLQYLSARLGTGKGGVRFAPTECVKSILGVPEGSVTPLAVANSTASNVVLLLDQNIKRERTIFVHPMDNTASLPVSPSDLEVFLQSVGRKAIWIDLEAEPKISKDCPPDLKAIADAAVPILTKEQIAANDSKSEASSADKKEKKKKEVAVVEDKTKKVDIHAIASAIIDKVRASESTSIRSLELDIVSQLNIIRNRSYAAGFAAANLK